MAQRDAGARRADDLGLGRVRLPGAEHVQRGGGARGVSRDDLVDGLGEQQVGHRIVGLMQLADRGQHGLLLAHWTRRDGQWVRRAGADPAHPDVGLVVGAAAQLGHDGGVTQLEQGQTVDDVGGRQGLGDRRARIGELAGPQRREAAQNGDEPVELEAASRELVQPPFQPVAEQRAELLAPSHPVQQAQRVAHPRAREVEVEGRILRVAVVVGEPAAAQHAGGGRVDEARGVHEAAVGVADQHVGAVGLVLDDGRAQLDALEPAVRADEAPCRAARPHLAQPPGGRRRDPGVEAVRAAVQRLAQQ